MKKLNAYALQGMFLLGTMLLLAAGPMDVMAQTGKITGRVIDATNGEPLPGVNVILDGLTRGATTNLDGEYVMIGVRPGVYTLIASFVGFATERREGISVNVDLTTTVDFSLREEVIEGEEIVVTAEAIAVRKDLTSSEARVTAETIDKLPVTELMVCTSAVAAAAKYCLWSTECPFQIATMAPSRFSLKTMASRSYR